MEVGRRGTNLTFEREVSIIGSHVVVSFHCCSNTFVSCTRFQNVHPITKPMGFDLYSARFLNI